MGKFLTMIFSQTTLWASEADLTISNSSGLGISLVPIVFIALIALFVVLIIYKNAGTPKGRMITGLTLISLGTAILFVMIISHYEPDMGMFFVVAHTIIGYLVLISALFCNKKKDESR
jgi:hypothetical protein